MCTRMLLGIAFIYSGSIALSFTFYCIAIGLNIANMVRKVR